MYKIVCYILMLAGCFLCAESLRRGFVGFAVIGLLGSVGGLLGFIEERR